MRIAQNVQNFTMKFRAVLRKQQIILEYYFCCTQWVVYTVFWNVDLSSITTVSAVRFICFYLLFWLAANFRQIIAWLVNKFCAAIVARLFQVFSAVTGEFRFRFGRKGHLPGQLMRPTGIAVTSSGNYLVADYENCSVNIFRYCWELV